MPLRLYFDHNVNQAVIHGYLSWRELRHATKDVRRMIATTNAQGEYTIEWTWDDYFNHFELLAGISVRYGQLRSSGDGGRAASASRACRW